MIESREVSVVIQGPVRNATKACFDSVRRILPNAEVIFSTWEHENLDGLEPDRLVRSILPPAFPQHRASGTLNNLNRLIRSSKAGVELAERTYVLKIRSDLILDNDKFIQNFDLYPARGSRSVFSHKVIVPLTFSRREYRRWPVPFHLSDWAAFGFREDIRNIFLPVEEVKEPEFAEYFLNRKVQTPFGTTTYRMAPEQYFCYSVFLHAFDDLVMKDASDASNELIRVADDFVVSNYLILNYDNTGWRIDKYPESLNEFILEEQFFTFWSEFIYQTFYKKHCDPSFAIPSSRSKEFCEYRDYYEMLGRTKKHIHHLMHAKFSKRFEQLLIIPFLSSKLAYYGLLKKFCPKRTNPIRFNYE